MSANSSTGGLGRVPTSGDLPRCRLPAGVHARLQQLLDRQDRGVRLSAAEREEAEGLVNLAEFFSLLRLRAARPSRRRAGTS